MPVKALFTFLLAALLMGAAYRFAPDEHLLNPPLVSDLSVPSTHPVRTTVTVVQQWVPRRGGAALAGYTPNGEAVTVMMDDDTERPDRMGMEATYDVVGQALGKGRIQALRLQLVKRIPAPHETIKLILDGEPEYTRTVGHWHQFQAYLDGKPLTLATQSTMPGRTVTGYWNNGKFITL